MSTPTETTLETDTIIKAGEIFVAGMGQELIELVDKVQAWGIERGITKANGATALSQLVKLQEELDELKEGLQTGDRGKVLDSVGDMIVVLIQICRLEELGMNACLDAAWDDIKDRKGCMMHGVFVKQADIDLVGLEKLKLCTDADGLRSTIDAAKAAQS